MNSVRKQSRCSSSVWLGASLLLFASVPQLSAQAVGASASLPGPAESAEPALYVLQRGDEIDIKVLNLPELSQQCILRPDGKISLLLLNDVEAAGLSSTTLSEKLTAAYSKHYRNPQTTVVVR